MIGTEEIRTEPVPVGTEQHTQLLQQAARDMLAMRRVMRLVVQQARTRTPLPETGPIGEAQLYALFILAEAAQLTAGDLAARCHVADPTMSKTLNHLELQGLVARRTDPTNRRVVQVTLTPAGRAMLERVGAEWIASLAQVLSPLTASQLQDLIVAMAHLESLVDPDERVPDAPSEIRGVK